MKNLFAILFLLLLTSNITSIYAQWQKNIIDDNITEAISVDVADFDGDKNMDLVVADWYGRKLFWYQNNFPQWNKYILDDVAATFAFVGDINNDTRVDVVAVLYNQRDIVWYENNYPTWNKHIIDNNTDHADFMQIEDINGDNKLDVITAGSYVAGGDVVWYENPNWTKHIIDSEATGSACLSVDDIDGDGAPDLVATMKNANKVFWYKNENKGLLWTKNIIDNNFYAAWGTNSGDINGDGKVDVVATSMNGNDVVWYENNHPTWNKYPIDNNLSGAIWADIVDVNSDGKMDVIVPGFNGDIIVWYENNLPNWTKYPIDANINGPRVFATADLDGDKVNDFIVPAIGSVVWYKNPFTSIAYGQTLEVYPKYIPPQIGDTIKIIAKISNPENHKVTAYAIINDDQNTFKDSVILFDDGFHNDGESSDNILGGSRWLNNLGEQDYIIKLFVTDQTITILPATEAQFTTKGPIIFKDWIMFTDTIPNPGDEIPLKLELINESSSATVMEVKGNLSSIDTSLAKVTLNSNTKYGDIPAGESAITVGGYRLKIDDNCPSDTVITFKVDISSNGHLFWEDTFTIKIDAPTRIKNQLINLPAEYMLAQNYPNPFNPCTTIKYSIPKDLRYGNQDVRVIIYDILGRELGTLVNEKQRPGNYEVDFDGSELTSGIYYYRLIAGNYDETKKMILLK